MAHDMSEQFGKPCGPRCSHNQTFTRLRELGYDPGPNPPRDASVSELIQAESSFNKAKHEAWCNGDVDLCYKEKRPHIKKAI